MLRTDVIDDGYTDIYTVLLSKQVKVLFAIACSYVRAQVCLHSSTRMLSIPSIILCIPVSFVLKCSVYVICVRKGPLNMEHHRRYVCTRITDKSSFIQTYKLFRSLSRYIHAVRVDIRLCRFTSLLHTDYFWGSLYSLWIVAIESSGIWVGYGASISISRFICSFIRFSAATCLFHYSIFTLCMAAICAAIHNQNMSARYFGELLKTWTHKKWNTH